MMRIANGCPGKLLVLLLGGGCFAFGQGRWPVPVAAVLAPILLVAFVRWVPLWMGVLGFTVVHAAAWEVSYLGMVKMPTVARWGLFLGLSFALSFVFVADRWISRRHAGFSATLVLPCGWVAFEYLNARFSPSGSWSSIAYTFADHHVLVQLASLVGWTGITFLVGWTAVVVHWVVRRASTGRPVRHGVMVYAGVTGAVLIFGSVRLWNAPMGETIRTASIVGPSSFIERDVFRRDVWAYTRGVPIPEEQVQAARQQIRKTMERHMALAERELQAGARIVSFPEANPSITEREQADFVEAAGRLAARYEAYIGLGLFVFHPESGLPADNKFILIGPDGTLMWDYLKATRVPGSSHRVGDGVLPDVETKIGRLSCAICFDMDFPRLLAQAGQNETDILIAPSNDWSEVRAIHARMAILRAVEQGFNLIRPTKDGFSLATDAKGRRLAWQDTDRAGEHAMIADVPTAGVRTLYATIGDAFSWSCMASMALFIAFQARARGSALEIGPPADQSQA